MSVLPFSSHGQLPDYWSHAFSLTQAVYEFSSKKIRMWVAPRLHLIAYVSGVNQENEEAGGAQDHPV